jgi:S-adenosylmethionine:tRNA ribosyltransferase-isomerase
MKLDDFDFDLPLDLIARYPLAKRSASRLLTLQGATGAIEHKQFTDILDLLSEGDLLIGNNTKVIPARLLGQKATGGHVEVLVERILDDHRMLAQVRVSKAPHAGSHLIFPQGFRLEVVGKVGQFYELRCNLHDHTILNLIESIGHIPLPPYLHRGPEESDKERYQTVYAEHKGSVAAPTAGLHFDDEMLAQLKTKGVEIDYLTLHIGAGTFAPVRTPDIREHTMHSEYLQVSEDLCAKILATRARGNKVVAVGTTSVRALETASQSGEIAPYQGETNIFIYPGYRFRCVDALLTNLHLPRSTLLMLVCAFGGHENVMHAYQSAVLKSYRFFSYGDAMWINKSPTA